GARPRTQGLERADLLHANGEIFKVQGAALKKVANRNVKVLVVGNPANTNANIAMKSATDIPPENFTALMRLVQHRAVSHIDDKINRPITSLEQMCVFGNHS
ncbi:lactate/malate family dehydrogenase, partial [Neisseria sp. P0015.S002]|uniref:lactate/malate family dehydrogenase n=1 Tax=Neisseria sp. P0015.S002 TaxID=3436758 RepID=UPI003F7F826B